MDTQKQNKCVKTSKALSTKVRKKRGGSNPLHANVNNEMHTKKNKQRPKRELNPEAIANTRGLSINDEFEIGNQWNKGAPKVY